MKIFERTNTGTYIAKLFYVHATYVLQKKQKVMYVRTNLQVEMLKLIVYFRLDSF